MDIISKKLSKIPIKILILQVICGCVLRNDIFITTGHYRQIYVEEYLNKRLVPYIQKHNGLVLFWSDLISRHYAKLAQDWYTSNSVNIVPKDWNPHQIRQNYVRSKSIGL